MKRILISFAGMAMLVSSSFAMTTSEDNNLMGGNGTENNYKNIQLETDSGLKAHGVLSKDQADKLLKDHTSGDKVKLHIKDDDDKNVMGQDTKDTTTPTTTDGVQQPAEQY